jgi:hypothetical protein
MKYSLISHAIDKKTIGIGPQCNVVPDGYTSEIYNAHNSMTFLTNDYIPRVEPFFLFEVNEEAKLTDILWQSITKSRGFLLSKKAKRVFETFVLPEHKFYFAPLNYKGEIYEYFYLHLVKSDYLNIDFSKSAFFLGDLFFDKISDIKINSLEELITAKNIESLEKSEYVFAERLSFVESFNHTSPDIFFFPRLHQNIFISKSAVEKLATNKITGYRLIEQNTVID